MSKIKGSSIIIGIVLIALVGLVVWGISMYNSLVSQKVLVDQSYSNINTQLQRRNDLIPNLVESVKGYTAHESEAIKSVSDARAAMMGAQSVDEIANANQNLSTALGRLFSITENYPDLKANQNFIALQDQLEGTENRIAQHRITYNEEVAKYNKKINIFPSSIVANLTGFNELQYFEATEGSEKVPEVSFD